MDSLSKENKSRFPKYSIKDKKVNLPEKVLDALQSMGKKFDLEQIILFGSRVRCSNGERSDIDLALYAKDTKQYFEILDFICKSKRRKSFSFGG